MSANSYFTFYQTTPSPAMTTKSVTAPQQSKNKLQPCRK